MSSHDNEQGIPYSLFRWCLQDECSISETVSIGRVKMARVLSSGATCMGLFLLITLCTLGGCQARNYKQVQKALGSNTHLRPMSEKAIVLNPQTVIDEIHKIRNAWNNQVIDRDTVTCKIVDHFRGAFPSYNCMVVHSHHLATFEDNVHEKMTLSTSRFSDTTFDIYVFKRGHFTLLGDGGFINWCFGGNFERDGSKVTFFNP